MELDGHEVVLEIGAGPGYFSPSLAAAVPDGTVVVADLQLDMARLAKERLSIGRNSHVLVADAMRLPFRSAAFGAVVLATMLGELPDPSAGLAEVRRVLPVAGVLIVAETRRDSDFLPLRRLVALSRRAGFELQKRRGAPWQFVARFRAT